MGRHELRAVPDLQPVPETPPAREFGETLQQSIDRTARLLSQIGAKGMDLTVADIHGVEIPVGQLDGGLPDQVCLQALAIFPDGHEVIGQSDPIERGDFLLYIHELEWMQALGDLRSKFDLPAIEAVPT